MFKILADNSKETLEPLYGSLSGILVSDRAKALSFWAMDRRQICWAHLLRKFVSFSERAGPAAAIGRELLDYTGIFSTTGTTTGPASSRESTFVAWMAALDPKVGATREAVAARIDGVSGSCANILEHQAGALDLRHARRRRAHQ